MAAMEPGTDAFPAYLGDDAPAVVSLLPVSWNRAAYAFDAASVYTAHRSELPHVQCVGTVTAHVRCMAVVSPTCVAAGDVQGYVHVLPLNGPAPGSMRVHTGRAVTAMCLMPDGTLLVSCSRRGLYRANLDIQAWIGEPIQLEASASTLVAVDNDHVLVCDKQGRVYIRNLQGVDAQYLMQAARDVPTCAVMSSSGALLVGFNSGRLHMWQPAEAASGQRGPVYQRPTREPAPMWNFDVPLVKLAEASFGGSTLVVCLNRSGTLQVLSMLDVALIDIPHQATNVRDFAITSGGVLVTCDQDRQLAWTDVFDADQNPVLDEPAVAQPADAAGQVEFGSQTEAEAEAEAAHTVEAADAGDAAAGGSDGTTGEPEPELAQIEPQVGACFVDADDSSSSAESESDGEDDFVSVCSSAGGDPVLQRITGAAAAVHGGEDIMAHSGANSGPSAASAVESTPAAAARPASPRTAEPSAAGARLDHPDAHGEAACSSAWFACKGELQAGHPEELLHLQMTHPVDKQQAAMFMAQLQALACQSEDPVSALHLLAAQMYAEYEDAQHQLLCSVAHNDGHLLGLLAALASSGQLTAPTPKQLNDLCSRCSDLACAFLAELCARARINEVPRWRLTAMLAQAPTVPDIRQVARIAAVRHDIQALEQAVQPLLAAMARAYPSVHAWADAVAEACSSVAAALDSHGDRAACRELEAEPLHQLCGALHVMLRRVRNTLIAVRAEENGWEAYTPQTFIAAANQRHETQLRAGWQALSSIAAEACRQTAARGQEVVRLILHRQPDREAAVQCDAAARELALLLNNEANTAQALAELDEMEGAGEARWLHVQAARTGKFDAWMFADGQYEDAYQAYCECRRHIGENIVIARGELEAMQGTISDLLARQDAQVGAPLPPASIPALLSDVEEHSSRLPPAPPATADTDVVESLLQAYLQPGALDIAAWHQLMRNALQVVDDALRALDELEAHMSNPAGCVGLTEAGHRTHRRQLDAMRPLCRAMRAFRAESLEESRDQLMERYAELRELLLAYREVHIDVTSPMVQELVEFLQCVRELPSDKFSPWEAVVVGMCFPLMVYDENKDLIRDQARGYVSRAELLLGHLSQDGTYHASIANENPNMDGIRWATYTLKLPSTRCAPGQGVELWVKGLKVSRLQSVYQLAAPPGVHQDHLVDYPVALSTRRTVMAMSFHVEGAASLADVMAHERLQGQALTAERWLELAQAVYGCVVSERGTRNVALLQPADFLVQLDVDGNIKVRLCSSGRFALEPTQDVEFSITAAFAHATQYWHPHLVLQATDMDLRGTRTRGNLALRDRRSVALIAAEILGAVNAPAESEFLAESTGVRAGLTISAEHQGDREDFVQQLRDLVARIDAAGAADAATALPAAGAAAAGVCAAARPALGSRAENRTAELHSTAGSALDYDLTGLSGELRGDGDDFDMESVFTGEALSISAGR